MIRKRIEERDGDGRRVTTVVEEPDEAVVEEYGETAVYSGPLSRVATMVAMLSWWMALAGVAVFTLLAFRLGFEMGEANPANNFVDFIYDITGPLIQPFQGIAGARTLDNGGIFHPETAIAMGVYAIATLLVVIAMNVVAGMIASADTEPVVRRSRMVRG